MRDRSRTKRPRVVSPSSHRHRLPAAPAGVGRVSVAAVAALLSAGLAQAISPASPTFSPVLLQVPVAPASRLAGFDWLAWLLGGMVLGALIVRLAWRTQRAEPPAPVAVDSPIAGLPLPPDEVAPLDSDLLEEEEAAAELPAEATPAMEPAPDTSGALLAQLQGLRNDFDSMVQGVQRYSSQREVQLQQWQLTSIEIIRRLLPVLDNLAPFLEDEDDKVAVVAQVAHARMLTELTTLGVTQIKPQPGEPFDARYHQLNVATDGLPPYQVASVVSPGFRFQPRVSGATETVLRPADVIGEPVPLPAEEPSLLDEDALAALDTYAVETADVEEFMPGRIYDLDEPLDGDPVALPVYEVDDERAGS